MFTGTFSKMYIKNIFSVNTMRIPLGGGGGGGGVGVGAHLFASISPYFRPTELRLDAK